MANPDVSRVPWLRDEVILALDVVLRHNGNTFPADSAECKELSFILNTLPLIPLDKRPAVFRNANGMSFQLGKLARVLHGLKPTEYMGDVFCRVLEDYPDRNAILNVAAAIRKNIDFSKKIDPSYFRRACSFRDGHLLEGIHYFLEDRAKIEKDDHCEICGMFPDSLYSRNISSDAILEIHCLVAPQLLNERTSLNKKNVITVCPTCHKVLHALRPWITENTLSSVIQWK